MSKIGYARVSTNEQTLDLQRDALHQAGCLKTFTDRISGAADERQGLDAALAYLRPGDTLVVWKLDRLGRSLKHLIATVAALQEQEIEFRSLTEQIDTGLTHEQLIYATMVYWAEEQTRSIRHAT